jgi:hypothetical protein
MDMGAPPFQVTALLSFLKFPMTCHLLLLLPLQPWSRCFIAVAQNAYLEVTIAESVADRGTWLP